MCVKIYVDGNCHCCLFSIYFVCIECLRFDVCGLYMSVRNLEGSGSYTHWYVGVLTIRRAYLVRVRVSPTRAAWPFFLFLVECLGVVVCVCECEGGALEESRHTTGIS